MRSKSSVTYFFYCFIQFVMTMLNDKMANRCTVIRNYTVCSCIVSMREFVAIYKLYQLIWIDVISVRDLNWIAFSSSFSLLNLSESRPELQFNDKRIQLNQWLPLSTNHSTVFHKQYSSNSCEAILFNNQFEYKWEKETEAINR